MKKLLFILVSLSSHFIWAQTADFSASPTTICVGGSVQFTDASTGASSWSWTFIDGGIGQSSSQPNPLITYSITGTYTVILTVSNGISSDTEIKTAFIQVVSAASATLSSAIGSDNQTTCLGNPIGTSITYNVVGATGASFSGLPAGVNGNFIPSGGGGVIVINGTPTSAGTFNYSITTSGSNCAPVTVNGTITVDPAPTISLTSSFGTDNQTVCANTSLTTIVYTIGGSATGATVSGLPVGVSGVFSPGQFTISGTPTNPGIYNYTVTTSGGACLPVSLSGSITVDATPSITLISSTGTDNQTICEGTPIGNLLYSLGGSATNASIAGLPLGLNATVSGGILTISGSPIVAGTYVLTITTIGGSCPATVITADLQVDAAPTINLTSSAGTDLQTICLNTPITNIVYSIGGSATSANVSGLPPGIIGTFAAGQLTISGSPISSGLFNYTVSTLGGSCTPVLMNGTIQVDALPTISLSSSVGSDNQTICAATALSSLTYTVNGSATGATISGLPSGTTMNVFAGIVTISGTPTIPGVYNYTITTTGGSCAPIAISGTITVDAIPTISLTSALGTENQIVCIGNAISNITYSIGLSATGGTVSGLPSGISGIFSAGTLTIAGNASVSGNFPYTVSSTGGSCSAINQSGTIQIDALPSLTLVSATGTDNQTVCAATPISSIDYAIGGSATSGNVTGLPIGMSATVASGIISITGNALIPGIYNYTVTSTGGTCVATTINGTITIDPSPTLTLISTPITQNQTACLNGAIQQIDIAVGGSATGAIVSGLPFGITASFAAGVLSISGTPTQTGTFPIVITSVGGTCTAITLNCTIIVQSPTITLSSPAFSNNQNICVNTAISTIQYIVSGPIIANDLPAGVTGVYTPGIPDTYTLSGTALNAGSYNYTLLTGGICGSNLVIGNITVAPALTGNTSGLDLTVCESSEFTLVGSSMPNSNIVNYNYLWQTGPTNVGPFVPAPGVNYEEFYIGQLSLGDPNYFFRRVVSTGTCTDTASAVKIILDTLPSISANNLSFTICSNDSLLLTGAGISNGIISDWSWNGNAQMLNTSSQTPTFIPSISDQGQTSIITYDVLSNNSCGSISISGTYTVFTLPDPVATAGGSAIVCANGTQVNITGANGLNGVSSWSENGNGFLSDTATFSPIYTVSLQDTNSLVTIELIVTSTGCALPISDTAHYFVTVLPFGIQPAINAFAGNDETISLGSSIGLDASGVAITQWNWSPSIGLSDSTASNPIANPVVTTDYILTVTDINGCMDQDTLRVTVNTDFDVFIPNLFSPNGDGFNDNWEIPQLSNYPNTRVTIINREGREIYSSDSYDNTWDGTFEGKKLPEATYYYLIEFANTDLIYKGAVSILRSKQ